MRRSLNWLGLILVLCNCVSDDSGFADAGDPDVGADVRANSDTTYADMNPDADPDLTDLGADHDANLDLTDRGADSDAFEESDVLTCEAPFELCGDECVRLETDRENCGWCGHECDGSDVCDSGGCVPSVDCREEACSDGYYCDLATGDCLEGCAGNDGCGVREVCNLAEHTCDCEEDYHRCGGICVSDDAVETCGGRCTVCPAAASGHGSAVCVDEVCGLDCASDYHMCRGDCVSDFSLNSCGSSCEPCDTDPLGTPTCDGSSCSFDCNPNALLCGGACSQCPQLGVMTVACDGSYCVAETCEVGYWPCDSGCCDTFVTEPIVPDHNTRGISATLHGGVFHVSYQDVTDDWVRVATGPSWTTEDIVSETGTSTSTGIAFDGTGTRHVLVAHREDEALYDYRAGERRVTLDTSGGTGPRLARDSEGGLHLAYNSGFQMARSGYYNGSWTTDWLYFVSLGYISSLDLALDSNGSPWVAARLPERRISLIDEDGDDVLVSRDVDSSPVLAIDGDDQFYVAYINSDYNATILIYGAEPAWEHSPCLDVRRIDLTLSDDDEPFLLCEHDDGSMTLTYMVGDAWTGVDIPTPDDDGVTTGLVLLFDDVGIPHVFFSHTSGLFHAHPN